MQYTSKLYCHVGLTFHPPAHLLWSWIQGQRDTLPAHLTPRQLKGGSSLQVIVRPIPEPDQPMPLQVPDRNRYYWSGIVPTYLPVIVCCFISLYLLCVIYVSHQYLFTVVLLVFVVFNITTTCLFSFYVWLALLWVYLFGINTILGDLSSHVVDGHGGLILLVAAGPPGQQNTWTRKS